MNAACNQTGLERKGRLFFLPVQSVGRLNKLGTGHFALLVHDRIYHFEDGSQREGDAFKHGMYILRTQLALSGRNVLYFPLTAAVRTDFSFAESEPGVRTMTDNKALATSGYTLLPQLSGSDVAHTLMKAGISAIPYVGGSIAEVIQLVLQPPIEKRRQQWLNELAARLHALEVKGISLESLQSNEQFISATLHATTIAMRTHQQEKLQALQNALLNIATGQAPDEILQSIFLNMVDVFTEWHILILRLFQHPVVDGTMTELYEIVEHAYPALKGRGEVYDTIWSELSSRELVNMRFLHGALSGMALLTDKRTTPLGDLFLQFISQPPEHILRG